MDGVVTVARRRRWVAIGHRCICVLVRLIRTSVLATAITMVRATVARISVAIIAGGRIGRSTAIRDAMIMSRRRR